MKFCSKFLGQDENHGCAAFDKCNNFLDNNNHENNSLLITYYHWTNSKEGINLWTELNEREKTPCYRVEIFIQMLIEHLAFKLNGIT